MRFDRAPDERRTAISPSERLVRRTSRGLAFVTLGLIAALLAIVGVVTATVAIGMTERNVDRTLAQAAAPRLEALGLLVGEGDKEEAGRPDEDEGSGGDDDKPDADDGDGGRSDVGAPDHGGGDADEPGDHEDGETTAPSTPPNPAATAAATDLPLAGIGPGDGDDRALESADTFFLVLDRSGMVISNPQRVALAGLPDAAAVASAAAVGEDWRSVVADDVHVRLLTQSVVNGDGEVVATLQSGFVLTLHDQQTTEILVTVLLVGLTGLVGAAVVTILVTYRALGPIRTAFAAERRFVAAASHELRTPVSVVRASAEILQREDLIKPGGENLVADIVSESDRLGRLVGDLLALASADAGQIDVHPRQIEMRAFVAELARRVESLAGERGVSIEVVQQGQSEPAERELLVNADPDRMTQLLLIFIDNAIDHSPVGGTVQLLVGPAVDGARPQVAIGVADHGPGVPHEERDRIFEPFARLTGRRRETGNTGLGLAIARILAARQAATLHIDDAVGGGAVFSVWLPRRRPAEVQTGA